eukprot:3298472-Rhodomonas_salina.1
MVSRMHASRGVGVCGWDAVRVGVGASYDASFLLLEHRLTHQRAVSTCETCQGAGAPSGMAGSFGSLSADVPRALRLAVRRRAYVSLV